MRRRALIAATGVLFMFVGSACGPAAVVSPAGPTAVPAPPPPTPAQPGPFEHGPTRFVFPPVLGEMVRGQLTDFERRQAGLGVSIVYRAASRAWASLYIYTMGLPAVPDDVGSAPVDAELRRCVREVLHEGETGTYRDLRLTRPAVTALGRRPGSPPALAVGFTFVLEGEPMLSRLYLTTWRNHFFKIRFSYPMATREASERALDALLDALGQRLRRPAGASGGAAPARDPGGSI